MKYAIAFLALGFSAPLHATQTSIDDLCESMGNLAEEVINVRYIGVTRSRTLAIISEGTSPKVREYARAMVNDAYSEPLYSTDEYIARAYSEFRNKWEGLCYSHFDR
jgi:hypothetical protein